MAHRLGGRYELLEQIGGGGMAVVYKATDTMLNRTVAVKMLRPQYADDEEFVSRFRQEAQSAARLSHPNIVNLYDIGVMDEQYYIVMEYVDGPTLKDIIRDRGPLSVTETIDITSQICDALEHAHDHHIIHRDIKPHNILLNKAGRVKVTDFGIARAITGNTITHHPTTSVLGSVHYFSPEQARGGASDEKSDIYSLGIVMYEMLTKQIPFSGDSPVSVALKHLREECVEPRTINKKIPQSVENIILKCLVKSPDGRYPNMRALKADLKESLIHPDVPKFITPNVALDQTIAVPVIGAASPVSRATESNVTTEPVAKKRKWWIPLLWTGVAFTVLCAGAVAAYYIVIGLVQVPNLNLPNVVGKTEAQAMQKLQAAGFSATNIQEKRAPNASYAKGTVYSQDPAGPTQVKASRQVVIYVSNGQPQITMPNLVGLPADQGIQQLVNLGIAKSNVQEQYVYSDSVTQGNIVSTTPEAGANVDSSGTVVVQVSKGAESTVPDVTGMTLDDATRALQGANLAVGQILRQPYNGEDGTVFKMSPDLRGKQVPAGTKFDLYVVNNAGGSGGGLGSPAGNNGLTNNTGNSGGAGSNDTSNTAPGNGSNNNTSTNTGDPLSNLPSDTKAVPAEIKVPNDSGQPLDVKIVKSDATGPNQVVTEQSINQTTSWTLTVYVTPSSNAKIMIYENGRLVTVRTVTY